MMLKSRLLLSIFRRKFCDNKNQFKVETLCRPENRLKCLDRMKLATNAATDKSKPSVTAAVLILLIEKPDDEPSILYTLRSNKLRKHVRQVSFPGGFLEENDESHIDCAFRETYEEIGITRDRITLWGETSLLSLRNSPAIVPVIGSISNYQSEHLKLNYDEVERVFTVPISELCKQRRHTQFRLGHQNDGGNEKAPTAYSLPVYLTNEERIWGITAIITHLFLNSLLPTDTYRSRIPYISRYR